MSLADFQQAAVDMTASPEFCRRVRATPDLLRSRYSLTDREFHRIVGVVNHRGMECNCILYRTNRLAPLALNLPDTCVALGSGLKAHVEAFWAAYPESNVHFFIEVARFCAFVSHRLDRDRNTQSSTRAVLQREAAAINAAILESNTEAVPGGASIEGRHQEA